MRPHSAARTTPRRRPTRMHHPARSALAPAATARRSIPSGSTSTAVQSTPATRPRRPTSSTAGPRPPPTHRGLCSQVRQQSIRWKGSTNSSLARPATTAPPTATRTGQSSGPAGCASAQHESDQQHRGDHDGQRSRRRVLAVRETPAPPAISGRSQAAPATATRTSCDPGRSRTPRPTATRSRPPPPGASRRRSAPP